MAQHGARATSEIANLAGIVQTALEPAPIRNVRAEAKRRAQEVRAFLEQLIGDNTLPAGSKLPTERELVERLGAARNTVRRVLSELVAEGRIVRQVGRGTFVGGPVGFRREELSAATSPADIIEARLQLEPSFVDIIVRKATSADLDHLRRCAARADAGAPVGEFERWDEAFHHGLALATHNPLLIKASEAVAVVRRQSDWGKLKQASHSPERRRRYQSQHLAIVAALCERDAEAARARLVEHLTAVRVDLLGV